TADVTPATSEAGPGLHPETASSTNQGPAGEQFSGRSLRLAGMQYRFDGQDRQLADGLVSDAAGHVDDDTPMQLDFFVVEGHRALAVDDVVDFVGLLVVVQLGVVDLDVVDLGGGTVGGLDQRTDLAAGLGPGLHVG